MWKGKMLEESTNGDAELAQPIIAHRKLHHTFPPD
jgi:hypothetical protein